MVVAFSVKPHGVAMAQDTLGLLLNSVLSFKLG